MNIHQMDFAQMGPLETQSAYMQVEEYLITLSEDECIYSVNDRFI